MDKKRWPVPLMTQAGVRMICFGTVFVCALLLAVIAGDLMLKLGGAS